MTIGYNVRKKTYADGTQQFMFHPSGAEVGYEIEKEDKPKGKRGEGDKRAKEESRKRAVQMVYDLAKSTMWDWFITLTFDPKQVDSYDYDECSKYIQKFTRWLRDKSKDFVYLFVPEKHESGRYHFHAVIKGPLEVKEALNPWGKPILDDKGHQVYNVLGYEYGFTTAVKVYSNSAIGYIAKYITKQDAVPPNKKRYWASRSIPKPIIEYLQMPTIDYVQAFESADYVKQIKGPNGDYLLVEYHGEEVRVETQE